MPTDEFDRLVAVPAEAGGVAEEREAVTARLPGILQAGAQGGQVAVCAAHHREAREVANVLPGDRLR